MPLLALSHPLQFAVPLVLALDFTASLVLGGANTKKTDWKEIKIPAAVRHDRRVHRRVRPAQAADHPVLITLGAFTMFFGFRNIFGVHPMAQLSRLWAMPTGITGGSAGALFGTSGPPYIIYLTHRLKDKTAVRATFSWLFVIDGGFRLGIFLVAGLLFDSKLQLAYVLGLIPMADRPATSATRSTWTSPPKACSRSSAGCWSSAARCCP